MIRYFKGTDGKVTVFRASKTMAYTGVMILDTDVRFTTKPLPPGFLPVEEIVKSEYDTLVARKNTYLKAQGKDPGRYNSPFYSRVPNASLGG